MKKIFRSRSKQETYPAIVFQEERDVREGRSELFSAHLLNEKIKSSRAKKICFTYIKAPEKIAVDDLSITQDQSVIGFINKDVFIVSTQNPQHKIIFPSDCSGMFNGLSRIVSIDFSQVDTSNVKNMSSMFYGCSSLEILNLSSFNTQNVVDMSWMFHSCKSLYHVDLKNLQTGKVRNMSHMFSSCISLVDLDVNHFDTSNVIDITGMFYLCTSLKNLDLSCFDTSQVQSMQYLFLGCKSLTSVFLKNWKTPKAENMCGMFSDCISLSTVDLSSFNTSKVTNMHSMFSGCWNLMDLDLRHFDTLHVIDMKSMFFCCWKLKHLDLTSFQTNQVKDMSSMFFCCELLETLDISHFDTSNVETMEEMFYGCDCLETLNLDNFNTIHVTNMKRMFFDCSNLSKLYSSSWDISSVIYSEEMFTHCEQLAGYSEYGKLTVYDPEKVNASMACSQNGYFSVPLLEWKATVHLVDKTNNKLVSIPFVLTPSDPQINAKMVQNMLPKDYVFVDPSFSIEATQDQEEFLIPIETSKCDWQVTLDPSSAAYNSTTFQHSNFKSEYKFDSSEEKKITHIESVEKETAKCTNFSEILPKEPTKNFSSESKKEMKKVFGLGVALFVGSLLLSRKSKK